MPGLSDGDVEGTDGRGHLERFQTAVEDELGRGAVDTGLCRLAITRPAGVSRRETSQPRTLPRPKPSAGSLAVRQGRQLVKIRGARRQR
jgi:hypothetical protein